MFEVKGEGLTDEQVAELTNVCTTVCRLAHDAATNNVGNKVKWFGALANSGVVSEGLKTMDKYLNNQCVRITFVRKNTGQIVDQVPAEASDYGQVLPNIMTTTANFRKTPKHTSSGLRIFAMNEIVNAIASGDKLEKVNYVYHEVSHKVLDTVDYKYGKASCKKLAINKPNRAVRNADNWGYYIAEMA
jgi:hypothetical protein